MKNSINFNIMTNMNQNGIKSIKITATVEKTINKITNHIQFSAIIGIQIVFCSQFAIKII